jgi:hypothetical protein
MNYLRASALFAILASGSCSWNTTLSVANYSDGAIQVAYSTRRLYTEAAIAPISAVRDYETPWTPLDTTVVRDRTHDTDTTRAFHVRLGPDSALRLASLGSYSGPDSIAVHYFPLTELILVGSAGNRSWHSEEILRAATKYRNNHNYSISYP